MSSIHVPDNASNYSNLGGFVCVNFDWLVEFFGTVRHEGDGRTINR